jgi:23S rRNA (cytosine1962-C5)-methyltransferase
VQFPIVNLKINRNSTHPWIFARMVEPPLEALQPGALVEVRSRSGAFACWGSYHPKQMIMVRVLGEDPATPPCEESVVRTLTRARELREEVLRLPDITDSYRLVHSEADGLCGFVVDKLGDVIAIESFSAAINTLGMWIARALSRLYPSCRVAVLPADKIERLERVSCAEIAAAWPAPASTEVREHGLRFGVDFATGHKTGFFLDQRDNRLLVRRMARDAAVLDLCCYTGGFALNAAAGGAARVVGVDLDEKAIARARRNAEINGVSARCEFLHADAFDYLRETIRGGERFDLVIADPAKFVPRRDDLAKGLAKYRDLNRLAVQAVKPGGVLVTCSCSGLVDRRTFYETVRQASADAGRTMQVLYTTGAGPDHPVWSAFPEGEYLKALFARVV